MICAQKQFFVHTLATMVCRTVVIGIQKAIHKRFISAIGSWIFKIQFVIQYGYCCMRA